MPALALAALLLPASLSGGATAQKALQGSPPAARGRHLSVSGEELEGVLLTRFGTSPEGRELLRFLVSAKVLDLLGTERGIEVGPDEIARAWNELDRGIRSSGDAGGLPGKLESEGLETEEFRQILRLSVLQELLTRTDLALPDGVKATGDQQEIWLEDQLSDRGLETLQPPWSEGVVARGEGFAVGVDELGRILRERLAREDVLETAWHLLLLAGIEERMPEVSEEARARAIDAEIERRRRESEGEHPSLSFEQMLGAQGRTIEGLRADPSVRIAALTRLHVDRSAGPEGLRRTYDEERAFFEGRFGKALRTHMLFLVAARFRNDLNPRTFEEAEEELARLVASVGNADDFAALARTYSEEPNTRPQGGDIGWMTRADPRVPAPVPRAAFRHLDAGGEIPPEGVAVGPVRLDTGCAMLWVSGVRPSLPWEEMSLRVHEELRRRFLEGILPAAEVELVEAAEAAD